MKLKHILLLIISFLTIGYDALACSAITEKGTKCKRSGEPYCWQHSSSSKTTSAVTTPKSYQVYQQRKEQGSRSFTPAMRKKMYQKQGGICKHCGKWFKLEDMDADHIIPYSKGGKTEESNCQMLCKHCNRSKGNRKSY